jgi:hypothetical protein
VHVSAEVVDAEQERDLTNVYDVNVDELSRHGDVLTLVSLVTPLEWVRLLFRAVLALSVYDTGVGNVLSAYRAVGERRRVRGFNQGCIAGMVKGYVDRRYERGSTALLGGEEHGCIISALRFVNKCYR